MNLASFVPGLSQAQWIATGVAAAVLVGTTGFATYKVVHNADVAKYDRLVIADQNARIKAVTDTAVKQKALDNKGTEAAVADAQAQEKIVTRYITLTKEVPAHVTPAQDQAASAPGARPGCVSYGLVRLLDGAVLGVEPSSLALPAGKSDDDCAPVEPSALAGSVTGNYRSAQQNAQQLNDLIGAVQGQAAILALPPT